MNEEKNGAGEMPQEEVRHPKPSDEVDEVEEVEGAQEKEEISEIDEPLNEEESSAEVSEEGKIDPPESELALEDSPVDNEVVALLTAMGMGQEEAAKLISGPKDDNHAIQKVVLPSIELSEDALEKFAAPPEEPVVGFQTIFQRIGDLDKEITEVESEVATTLVTWVQTLREDLIEIRTSIGYHFAEKLKMKMFKKFVEKTYEDIFLQEFEKIESLALRELTQRLSENFHNARTDVATAEKALSRSVEEQERIVRSYLSSIERETNELRDNRLDLMQELEMQNAQLERLKEQARSAGTVAELERELKVRKDELVLLKKQIEEREKERIDLANQLTELSALRTAVHRRDEQIDKQKDTIASLRNRVSEIEGRLEAQKHELETLTEKEQTIATLEERVGTQRAKILELTEHLDTLQADLATEGIQVEKIKEQAETIANLRAQLSKQVSEVSTARSEIEILQGLRQTVNQQESLIEDLREQLTTVQSKLSVAEARAEFLERAEETLVTERKTYDELRQMAIELEAKLASTIVERDSLEERVQTLLELRDKNIDLEAKYGAAQGELEALKRRVARLPEAEAELATLQGKLNEMISRIRNYEVEFERLEQAEETILMQQKTISDMREHHSVLEERLGATNAENEGLKRQLEHFKESEEVISKLRGRIAEHERTIKDYEEEFKLSAEIRQEATKQQQKMDALQTDITNLESELGTSQARLETANSENERLRTQLEKTEADRTEMAKLRQRVADLQDELTKAEAEAEKTQTWETSPEYAQLMSRLDTLAEQFKMQRRILQQLREGIKGDPKYDMLFMLQDIEGTMSVKELAQAIGVPSALALRYAMEFAKLELATLDGEDTEARVTSVVARLNKTVDEASRAPEETVPEGTDPLTEEKDSLL